MKLDEPLTINTGLRKQDVVIADVTNAVRFTVWEEDVNMLKVGQSYDLKSVVVREYRNVIYLTTAKGESEMSPIEDIGEVDSFNPQPYEGQKLHSSAIVGVQDKKVCFACRGRIETTSPTLGHCSKCDMVQRLSKCQSSFSAKLIVVLHYKCMESFY